MPNPIDPHAGLTTAQAKQIQLRDGKNVIPQHHVSALKMLLKQFKSAIVILMLVAGIISWVVADISGAVIILIIITVNAIVGFYQEYRAEKKLYKISGLVQPTATVKRDGKFGEILREDVVKGDLIRLTPGVVAPADIDLTFSDGLLMNESSITGESLPVEKNLSEKKKVEMGTSVTSGMGEGIATATGAEAVLGEIVNLVETGRPTNFEKEIRKLTELCIGIIIVTASVLFIAKLIFHPQEALSIDFVIFLLAICIGILPETLPLIATVALSNGALTLSRQGVVVRNLSAIQDLGSITVLCSDKTGTLTENTLKVADKLICDERLYDILLHVSCSIYDEVHDPFQHALTEFCDKNRRTAKLLHTVPFDAAKRTASFVVAFEGREFTIVQGAHEVVDGEDKMKAGEIAAWIQRHEQTGQRVLAFAIEESGKRHLAALISFIDPIRLSARKSITHAGKLGVRVKVISGDSEHVTGAIAGQLDLLGGKPVISGFDWEKHTDDEKKALVQSHSVFARFLPVQKYEIIRLLQQHGEIVGYMGDGVNDAPSLKLADVGIAVANATDIAKDASDIIMLRHGLGVVVKGIEQGRAIFENVSKYIRETLTENLGNFLSISVLSLVIPYLPMLPIQILVTNLITDFPHLAIATDNVDIEAVRKPRRFNLKSLVRFMIVLSLISSAADMTYFGLFRGLPPSTVQSGWFIFSTFAELASVFSVRSRSLAFNGNAPSLLLSLSSLGVAAFVIGEVFWQPLGQFMKLTPIGWFALMIILLIAVCYFVVFDVVKALIYRYWPESY